MGKSRLCSFWMNLWILLGFTVYFLLKSNSEFLIYTFSVGGLIAVVAVTDRYFRYTRTAKAGFTLWLVMHLLGGSVYISGTRLYDLMLIELAQSPYNIFKYDQLVHVICYIVMTMLIYSVVRYCTKGDANRIVIGLITVLAGIGIGAINEIIEFSAVVFFESSGVGGYYNNALDLIFNLTGAAVAMVILKFQKLI